MTIESADEFLELLNSDDPDARDRLRTDVATDEVWLETLYSYPQLAAWVATNETVSLRILRLIGTHSDATVRRHVVLTGRLVADDLRTLAADPDPQVRSAVACQLETGDDVLVSLLADQTDEVRMRAFAELGRRAAGASGD